MIRILGTRGQIEAARRQMAAEGLDTSRGWSRFRYAAICTVRFRCAPEPVAVNKSWDVLNVYRAVTEHAPDRAAKVFEMGSYNSEIPLVLWRAGYRDIRASDFNPIGRSIRWYGNGIDFRCENFYEPDLKPESVGVMTAVSVIEHGFDGPKLAALASKLLKPGGVFFLTTDYRDPKVEVPASFRAFNLPWLIFSRADIEALLAEFQRHGLEPVADLQWGQSEYPISWEGYDFTNILVGVRKVR